MERVVILGCCGAGKSTLARQLGIKLELPVIHLDTYFWQAGWVESDPQAWQAKQASLLTEKRWIVDGNYTATLDLRIATADTIIYLDFPRYLCLWRILKRYWQYKGTVRPDMSEGCPERLNWNFFVYVWQFNSQFRELIFAKLKLSARQKRIIILKPAELNDFLASINSLALS